MKRKMAVIVFGVMVNTGIFSQGYPVMDITNILASIQNGYTMVQQLQAMYNNIKTAYDQLQQQIKNFESYDLNNLKANDPLGSWKSISTYANRMMTYESNIESILNKKDIKIGTGSYSLSDLFTTPPNKTAQKMATNSLSFVIDPLEKGLSKEEKGAFQQKYGMSYGNYMRLNQMGAVLKRKAAEATAYSNMMNEELAKDREQLQNISSAVSDSESIVQQQQVANMIMTAQAQDVKTQAQLLGNIAQQLATHSAYSQIEKQVMQDEMNMNDLGLPEGFIRMLNEMPDSGKFK